MNPNNTSYLWSYSVCDPDNIDSFKMEARRGLNLHLIPSDRNEEEHILMNSYSPSSSSASSRREEGSSEDLPEEMDTAAGGSSLEETADPNEKEWLEETSEKMISACRSHSWETFEEFLSDKTISKRKKK